MTSPQIRDSYSDRCRPYDFSEMLPHVYGTRAESYAAPDRDLEMPLLRVLLPAEHTLALESGSDRK